MGLQVFPAEDKGVVHPRRAGSLLTWETSSAGTTSDDQEGHPLRHTAPGFARHLSTAVPHGHDPVRAQRLGRGHPCLCTGELEMQAQKDLLPIRRRVHHGSIDSRRPLIEPPNVVEEITITGNKAVHEALEGSDLQVVARLCNLNGLSRQKKPTSN